ncbi:NAD(P)H dehydrogenase (quinone) [Pedobacter cryoconitis]|uniref:NAD(P)H dehydrogenase (Quinone) n=2 Tax=Pedobacter cryoconitis TaxID=188932 RepID=A0A7W8ZIJ2_9SPHI|nr:NAD(P)H dehydrogenase (quinone) [Pedobacter cryoconitis]MBB6272254.1 NAD(P)H dehydrogenase (quinone) [Pedobacter cryoconitis]
MVKVQEQALQDGHLTRVRDLYTLNFNPVLSAKDIVAFKTGNIAEDILQEQEHIKWADIITLIHPIWWTGMPGLLKGYFDRVLSYGFAYRYGQHGIEQMLAGKKMYIINTVGSEEQNYNDKGIFKAMRIVAENTFGFTGLQIEEHRFFSSVITAGEETINEYLTSLKSLFPKTLSV